MKWSLVIFGHSFTVQPMPKDADAGQPDYELEPLTFSEKVAVDNYTGAMSGALAATDSLADKVVGASLAVATAYGAVIALVAPKDSQTPWQGAIPFIFLASAVGLALWAQSIAISIEPEDELDKVSGRIESTIIAKRRWGRAALAVLAAGMLVAGVVVYAFYGPSAKQEEQPAVVSLYLTPVGASAVAEACGQRTNVLRGTVTDVNQLEADFVTLKVAKPKCVAGTIILPQRAIAVARALQPSG